MKLKLEERKVETQIRDMMLVEQRRDEIIKAAGRVFSQKGYHQTTIRDISNASGLTIGTIYNYVKKKEDILYLVYNKLTSILTKALIEKIQPGDDPVEQLTKAVESIIQIAWEYQELIILMYQETAALDKESLYNVLKRESDYVSLIEQILQKGRRTGVIKNQDRMAADIIVYLLAFIPLRRWNIMRKFQEAEIKSQLIRFILQALGICDKSRKG